MSGSLVGRRIILALAALIVGVLAFGQIRSEEAAGQTAGSGLQVPLGMERTSAERIVGGSSKFIEIGYVLRTTTETKLYAIGGTFSHTYRIHHNLDQWERGQVLWHVWNADKDPGPGPFSDYGKLAAALGGSTEVARGIHKIETNLKRTTFETNSFTFPIPLAVSIPAGRYLVLGASRTQNAPTNSNTFGIYNFEIQLLANVSAGLVRVR